MGAGKLKDEGILRPKFTKAAIARKLSRTATNAWNLANDMAWYGQNDEAWRTHEEELRGAAATMREWISEIKKEVKNETK